MSRSDDSLAPVTYLFGAPPAGESSEQSSTPITSTHVTSTPIASATVTPAAEPEPRWATPGIDLETDAATPAEPTRDERRAHNVGLNALTRRGQSVAEMTTLLESRDLDEETVAAEIKRLKSVGLLDDFALAETLVRTLSERKGLGTNAIRSEMRQRKINPIAIDAALESVDGDDELERAIEIAVKRAGQLSSYDQATAKRRLGAFLQRRGYSGSILSAAMAAALEPASNPRSTGPRFT